MALYADTDALRIACVRAGLSVTALAAQVSHRAPRTWSRPHLSNVVSGRRGASAPLAKALADVLGKDIGELFPAAR